jgi:hypothetical protein
VGGSSDPFFLELHLSCYVLPLRALGIVRKGSASHTSSSTRPSTSSSSPPRPSSCIPHLAPHTTRGTLERLLWLFSHLQKWYGERRSRSSNPDRLRECILCDSGSSPSLSSFFSSPAQIIRLPQPPEQLQAASVTISALQTASGGSNVPSLFRLANLFRHFRSPLECFRRISPRTPRSEYCGAPLLSKLHINTTVRCARRRSFLFSTRFL